MTDINLNTLPYPMFKLSEHERELLANVYSVYEKGKPSEFLCITICDWMRVNCPFGTNKLKWAEHRGLVEKISDSLIGLNTLNTYLCVKLQTDTLEDLDDETNIKARKIWVEKLLAQTGESL